MTEQTVGKPRNVSAGGASFRVTLAGEGDHTFVLLHDFPENSWAWRQQIPALAEAGHRVISMDLRGFGGSDLQPGPVQLPRLTTDVTSVVRALGTDSYTVVGAGMGGAVAWLLAHQQRWGLDGLVTLAAPHPLNRWRPLGRVGAPARRAARSLRGWHRRQRLQSGESVARTLTDWCAPENRDRQHELVPEYAAPLARHFAAECALDTWDATQNLSADVREQFQPLVDVPVLSLRGAADPFIPASAYTDDASHTTRGVTHRDIPHAGRYLAEEAPEAVTRALLSFK